MHYDHTKARVWWEKEWIQEAVCLGFHPTFNTGSDKSLNLPITQLPHLYNGDNNSTYLLELRGLTALMYKVFGMVPEFSRLFLGGFFFEFYFILFFIQHVLISYRFYTRWCVYVNPNLPIHPTTTNHAPSPHPRFRPLASISLFSTSVSLFLSRLVWGGYSTRFNTEEK